MTVRNYRLPPGEMPRPPRQKAHHGQRDRPFPIAPGEMFDHHSVLGALHPPGGVEEDHLETPQRHKKPGTLGHPVITGAGPQAARAAPSPAPVRLQSHFDALGLASAGAQLNVSVNETGEPLNPV
jgi:hypothetical protein